MPAPVQEMSFLFTDVESSSAMWEAEPAAMGHALRIHDQLVSSCIAAAGGEIVKNTGDGANAVFATPAAAVAAAVALMRALQRQNFPELRLPFRVRMGVHTGTAERRDGDYFGRAVNRAVRIMDAANGNQIVVSATTAAQCPEWSFEDMGTHELKGIGVERLMLVRSDDLVVDPRPLRVSRASNLPLATNAVVGRVGLAASLASRLQAARTLTLVGTGGVGKTRLVLLIAERVAEHYPDGAWFCDLGNLSDPTTVVPAVAEILGAPPLPGRPLASSIGAHLAGRRVLVILDNCEHVLGPAQVLAREILRQAPACAVAATSREPVRHEGEQVVVVDPLEPHTEGLDLFVQRARERDPGFRLDPTGEIAARDICARLDGLPLAIELAAARLGVLSPESIARRLEERFKLLRGGSAPAGRHSTLLNTIQWSYDLLLPEERELFDSLAAFSGGFSLDAAVAVAGHGDAGAGDEYEVLDLLSNLVDKSMVQRDPDRTRERFVLLESLREFGRRQLAATGRTLPVTKRHIGWYAALATAQAEQLLGPEEPEAWLSLSADWDNLRVAVARAVDMQDLDRAADIIASVHYFSVIALHFEGLTWSEQWLAQPDAGDHPRHASMRAVASSAAYTAMDLERARDLAQIGDDSRDLRFDAMPFTAIWAFLALADVAGAERFVAAWLEAEQSLRPRPFDRAMVAAAAAVLDGVMRRQGPEAELHLDRLDDIAASTGAPSLMAYAHMIRGTALARIDPARALEALDAAATAAHKVSERHAFIDGSETATAQILSHDPDPARTVGHCRAALESASQHRFLPRIAHDLQSAAIVLARCGEAPTGARLLGASGAMGQRSWGSAFRLLQAEIPGDFHRLVAEGAAMSPQAAAEEALAALSRAAERRRMG